MSFKKSFKPFSSFKIEQDRTQAHINAQIASEKTYHETSKPYIFKEVTCSTYPLGAPFTVTLEQTSDKYKAQLFELLQTYYASYYYPIRSKIIAQNSDQFVRCDDDRPRFCNVNAEVNHFEALSCAHEQGKLYIIKIPHTVDKIEVAYRIIGYVRTDIDEQRNRALINHMWIHPVFRNLGIGAYAVSIFRKKYNTVLVYCPRYNNDTSTFWARQNLSTVPQSAELPHYYRLLEAPSLNTKDTFCFSAELIYLAKSNSAALSMSTSAQSTCATTKVPQRFLNLN